MRCGSVIEALPAFVGGDLLPATAAAVETHVGSCDRCRGERDRQERVRAALRLLVDRDLEPPPLLADAITERVAVPRVHRLLPVPPIPPNEVARVIVEHRESIASAAGAGLVAAGVAWLLWRAARQRTAALPSE